MKSYGLLVYGDFNSPWSYLAARRLAALAATGVRVDWRGVEHHPKRCDGGVALASHLFRELQQDLHTVETVLLPGERFPYALAGFVPETGAAVCAYAEAYQLGTGALAREVLFESFWLHGLDLNDEQVVHTVMTDAIRTRSTAPEPLAWRLTDAGPHQVVSAPAYRLLVQWDAEWRAFGGHDVPVLAVPALEPMFGEDALAWLGAELVRRDVGVTFLPERPPALSASSSSHRG